MKIGFVGAGNMGAALLRGCLGAGVPPEDCLVGEISSERLRRLQDELGVRVFCSDNAALARESDLLFVSVKPDALPEAASQFAAECEGKPVVSIVTGATTRRLSELFPGARVCRVMPNTPALVGQGVFAVSRSHTLTDEEFSTVRGLLEGQGIVELVEERQMAAVVGVSGSAPAYLYLVIEALADAAVQQGLPRAQAYRLAAKTVAGSGEMVLRTGRHPGALKDEVCSPGGTTIEAIRVLETLGLRSAILEAAIAASEKAASLE